MPDTLAIRLPSELKHYIGTFCTTASLASLALVHTSYTAEAERALYHTLALNAGREQLCLQTLSLNYGKASLVQSILYENTHIWCDCFHLNVVEMLSNALTHTDKLRDIRIHLPAPVPEQARDMLNRVLLSGHLKLSTLYCNSCLDIAGLIRCHPELEFVGTYACWDHEPGYILDIVKDMYTPGLPSSTPTVIKLEHYPDDSLLSHLTIFPGFSPDPALVCRDVCSSINRYSWHDTWMSIEEIHHIYVYFKDSSDMGVIRDVLDGIVSSFPKISYFHFMFEHAKQIQYPELMKILIRAASGIREIHFRLWGYQDEDLEMCTDAQMAAVREWKIIFPYLSCFTFLHGTAVLREWRMGYVVVSFHWEYMQGVATSWP